MAPIRVVIAAGGTAGHVVPALAVADELRAEGAEVVFVGGERAEAELVPAAGYELRTIRVEGLSRTQPAARRRGPRCARRGPSARARRILRERAAPTRAGRRRLRRRAGGRWPRSRGASRSCSPRPTATSGLTNRLLAPFARRVCLAFPIDGRDGPALPRHRPAGAAAGHRPRGRARALRAGRRTSTCVLVFGGSLGARSINQAAIEAFADAPFRVLHAAGARDFELARVDASPAPHYDLRPYIDELRRGAARRATSCVARAGGSIFEIAAHGRPAVLVPYPHAAADHQTANARWMADAGAAVVVADDELTARGWPRGRRAARRPGAAGGDGARLGGAGAAPRTRRRPACQRG